MLIWLILTTPITQVCRLLEAEFHYAENAKRKDAAVSRAMQDVLELRDSHDTDGAVSNDYMQQRRASFVSFGTFLEEYWSHFSGTKGLGTCRRLFQRAVHSNGGPPDPTLVFGEFMGEYPRAIMNTLLTS